MGCIDDHGDCRAGRDSIAVGDTCAFGTGDVAKGSEVGYNHIAPLSQCYLAGLYTIVLSKIAIGQAAKALSNRGLTKPCSLIFSASLHGGYGMAVG